MSPVCVFLKHKIMDMKSVKEKKKKKTDPDLLSQVNNVIIRTLIKWSPDGTGQFFTISTFSL